MSSSSIGNMNRGSMKTEVWCPQFPSNVSEQGDIYGANTINIKAEWNYNNLTR